MKKHLAKIFDHAYARNTKNILLLLDKQRAAQFLDLGCDDGTLSLALAKRINTKDISGVEIDGTAAIHAVKRGIKVKQFDLNKQFDFTNDSFDVVHANQIIEHLYDADNFLSEIHRILKPGGYAVISTENASSWCNIFASVMGWQIFSLTNFSNKKQGIGNPFSLHRDGDVQLDSWNHIRIYNIRGLKEYFEVFGFKVEEVRGAGYFPLWGGLGNIDKTHCH